jgi:ribosomal protein L37AE/L43A
MADGHEGKAMKTYPPTTVLLEGRADYFCSECQQTTFPPYAHKRGKTGRWHVPASDGGYYEVLPTEKGIWVCMCPGYHFRGRCSHVYGTTQEPGVYALEAQEIRRQAQYKKHQTRVTLQELFAEGGER